jgi:hypothetical protein
MSLIPNNPSNVVESPIWNTLIPSRPELPDDIEDSNDNENEEDEDDDDDDDEEEDDDDDEEDDDIDDDDLSSMLVKSEEADYMCRF